MKWSKFFLSLMSLVSFQTFANEPQCEKNFTKEGSFFSGKTYKTWAVVEGIRAANVYKKVYLYTVGDGWKIISKDKELGIIIATQNVSYGKGKTAPLNIIVESASTTNSKISLTYSTSGGVTSPTKAVKQHFCSTIAAAKK